MNDEVAPSGQQHELAHGPYRATVVEVGGGIRTFTVDGQPLLEGYAADAVCDGGRGQLLLPWPNRIDGGRYRLDGVDQQLALTEPATGCAIHGLTRWANWHRAGRAPEQITLGPRHQSGAGASATLDRRADHVRLEHVLHPQPGWAATLHLAVTYTLAEDGLTVALEATNVGAVAAPFGTGAHPYLCAGAAPVDGWELTLPAATVVHTDERGLPTTREPVAGTAYDFRRGRALGALALDNPFTDLARDAQGRAWVRLRGPGGRGVAWWADEHHRWLQVFTGDHLGDPARRRTAVAVEPMTCPPNAFATGEDVLTLAPSEQVTLRWGLQALAP